MIPRLVRVYGGDPMTWLARTPIAVVQAHAAMVDPLLAEDSMSATTAALIGSGRMSRERARAQLARWKRLSSAGAGAPPPATPGALRAAGIGRKKVKRRG